MTSRTHLYLSSNFWDGLWIIQQPIANEIARHEPVLYVERFVSFFTVLRYPRLWRRLFTWLRGPRSISPTLRLLAPIPLFHLGHRFPWLFRLEFALQRRWILWWARRDRRGHRILWMDNPLYEYAIGTMGETLAVYHVADEITAFSSSHPEIVAELEIEMLQKVDVVFAAAESLANDKRRWQPRTYAIWNAIDTGAFAKHQRTSLPDLRAIPEPRVAFVGSLSPWVDLDLIALAASRLPNLHFVVVGPSYTDERALDGLMNVHRLGPRDRMAVPEILRQCSASLVPFKKNRLTERVVPLKVFEALAAGILPVCTDFSPDLEPLERDGYLVVGRTPEEFVRRLQRAVAADSPSVRQRLTAYGRQQTWEARWTQMRGFLADASLQDVTTPMGTA